ncbi:Zinc-finger domain protein [Thiorhodovibrio winogradskyi]|uniref:Zinc-finger domain protein n=1 Tax=Thiorhodovibrio winogradskyi TaxID=77007 RepID=A0ABZ0S4K3_9GAMM|nr:zinc-finger domain-containing protein [Thiorhodovibrio winogradskyi]
MEHSALPFSTDKPAPPVSPAAAPGPIKIQASKLPLSCPRPGEELWNMHPRVYLPIDKAPDRRTVCPYCGAVYVLEGEIGKIH